MKREPTWSEYYNAKQMRTGFAFQQPCLTFQALTFYPRAAQHSCNISLLHSEAAFEQIGIAAGPCCVYQHTSFPCQAFEFMVLGENKEEGDCMCCWKPGRLIESRNGGLPIQIPVSHPKRTHQMACCRHPQTKSEAFIKSSLSVGKSLLKINSCSSGKPSKFSCMRE